MLIILEGPDGTGKTTLAGELEELIGARVLHRGPPGQDVITEYARDIQWYQPGRGDHVVCDRWHLGEQVYGPILRGGSRFSRETFAHVEKVLQRRGAVLVVLTAPGGELRRRIGKRGDDLIGPERVDDLVHRYDLQFRVGTQLPRRIFSGQPPAAGDLLDWARIAEFEASALRLFITYVGPPAPRYLVLGERRNGSPPYPDQAAFTPGPSTSGRYLLSALPDRVLSGAGFANACEENVVELWEVLRRPRVIALGVQAVDACRSEGLVCSSAPHPQFIRRFYHRARGEYGALIEDLLDSGPRDELKWRP